MKKLILETKTPMANYSLYGCFSVYDRKLIDFLLMLVITF